MVEVCGSVGPSPLEELDEPVQAGLIFGAVKELDEVTTFLQRLRAEDALQDQAGVKVQEVVRAEGDSCCVDGLGETVLACAPEVSPQLPDSVELPLQLQQRALDSG